MIGSHESVRQSGVTFYVLVLAMLILSFTTPAFQPFSLKCYEVLRWEVGGTVFPGYQSLLPLTRDPMQEMFLNASGTDCMFEKGRTHSCCSSGRPSWDHVLVSPIATLLNSFWFWFRFWLLSPSMQVFETHY